MHEVGGSMSLAVLNGQYKFPPSESDPYSEGFRGLIRSMLVVDRKERADIQSVRDAPVTTKEHGEWICKGVMKLTWGQCN